jgi:hypothetical protein
MDSSRYERLHKATGFTIHNLAQFDDTLHNRGLIITTLLLNLERKEEAGKLEQLLFDHRKQMKNWKYSLEEKRQVEHSHATFFIRLACRFVNSVLEMRNEPLLEKDFLAYRFWSVVDECLTEIGRRRISKERSRVEREKEIKVKDEDDGLDERIQRYISTRPKSLLSFPSVTNMSDDQQSLLDAVLSDQRGLKSEAFGKRGCNLYDRRYVAALRARLFFSEQRVIRQQKQIRELEAALRNQGMEANFEENDEFETSGFPDNHRSKIAGALRDLSDELALLPERLKDDLNRQRQLSTLRTTSARPQYLESAIKLARGLSYDLTTLDLVDAHVLKFD